MKYKIKTINHDGTIIEVEVSVNVYNFDKENNWQEDWKTRKSKKEDSYEEALEFYEKMDCRLNCRKCRVRLNT